MCGRSRGQSDPFGGTVGDAKVSPPDDAGVDPAVDDHYIDHAIDLAWQAAGRTQPNPLVGAIVVKDGRILGEGCHQHYGGDHAETLALERAGHESRGGILYITLEPCAHHGHTPPCVERILESGVRRVVVSTLDPDERVNGLGVRILRENGISVDVGRGAERAFLLNMPYFKRVLGLGPAVTLKMAVTLDGRIASAPGSRDEITGVDARRMVHRLRATHDAVLVGINTFLVDSPRLDCRLIDSATSPIPVVLDSRIRFPAGHEWLGRRDFRIVVGDEASVSKEAELRDRGARVIRCKASVSGIDVSSAVGRLYEEGMASVLVEGGGSVFSSFVESGLWDGMFLFVSPVIFGPEGVGVTDRCVDRTKLGAVLAGTTKISGEFVASFVNERIHKVLVDRLLRER